MYAQVCSLECVALVGVAVITASLCSSDFRKVKDTIKTLGLGTGKSSFRSCHVTPDCDFGSLCVLPF